MSFVKTLFLNPLLSTTNQIADEKVRVSAMDDMIGTVEAATAMSPDSSASTTPMRELRR